jgi:adenylyltransferase/sulfurtransferase
MQLSAMGIGKLRIVDRDVVEISNLHRQHLYNEEDIGKVKVEVAAERLKKMNPDVEIEAIPLSITKYTAESIVKGMDIIIDALDSVEARYSINDACIKYNIPLIYSGALGMLGSVCTILPNQSACLRCIFPALAEEDMPTCSTEGVHPAILYLVSGIQVSEAIKILTGEQPRLVNKLLYIDLTELSLEKIQVVRHEECTSCGPRKETKKEGVVFRGDQLIIEEICGRERGRRTYTVTPPSKLSKPIDVAEIVNNAKLLGYHVKIRGRFGITATSTESDRLSISFLISGAATIVGAKDQEDALYIYRAFAKKLK